MTAPAGGRWPAILLLVFSACPAFAADLVALSPPTWDRYAPKGKEADAIYGDFVLANDQILAVVAAPKPDRDANMHESNVGGCLIDLTRRDRQSDQLAAFYPGARLRDFRFSGIDVEAPKVYETGNLENVFVQARRVSLRLVATPLENEPDVSVCYTLEDGSPSVELTSTFTNRGQSPVSVDLVDSIVADDTFEFSPKGDADLFWAYDKHFGQAYGVSAGDHLIQAKKGRRYLLRYQNEENKVAIVLAPGESYTLTRRIIPGANLFDVQAVAAGPKAPRAFTSTLSVKDTDGKPVAGADVVLKNAKKSLGWGRTDEDGQIRLHCGDGQEADSVTVSALGHGSKSVKIDASDPSPLSIELPKAGVVETRITDQNGGPIPCKIQFLGQKGTKDSDFGPDSAAFGVKNAYYSPDGQVIQPLEPGSYQVIISHGPEYDAEFQKIEVKRGETTTVEAKLAHSVQTDGWISGEFHSHSTPSGDNTASQLGRVLNHLCENIEFAPCTEHNRLSSYAPHLARLKATKLMATCVGMELTGSPLPLSHQNAFPLVMRPHTQSNGAPRNDQDPEIQIERLAYWDDHSDKLVEINHPDLGWMTRDRNGDHSADSGFARMLPLTDVVEVHPLHIIFKTPTYARGQSVYNNRVVNWLQLLNQGQRVPGVINTDAHTNFHGTGWRRNYIKSPTDDPSQIKTLDVVHACERGNIVMTTGPFLEVSLRNSDGKEASPGDDLSCPAGEASLSVKVQCPNWFDIDRIQVFLNGRPEKSLNFTRESTPERFSEDTVKFDQEIPVKFEKDTHILVVAIGEHSALGPVMGPSYGRVHPVAVSNPVYVDVDGKGFQPNGDTLGELPVKGD